MGMLTKLVQQLDSNDKKLHFFFDEKSMLPLFVRSQNPCFLLLKNLSYATASN